MSATWALHEGRFEGMVPYFHDDRIGITILHARCEDVLPHLERGGVILTDPPYSEHTHNNIRSAASLDDKRYRREKWRTIDRRRELGFAPLTPELRAFCAAQFARLASRWVINFSDAEGAQGWRDDLTAAGLDYVRTGAWIKTGGAPQFSGDRPAVGHEELVICHPAGRKRWNGGGKAAIYTTPIVLNRGGQSDRGGERRVHPAQKPVALMRQIVADFTEPGDLVIDPFGGSGTTARACYDLGRRCIVMETNEAHCEAAARRFEQGVLALMAATAGH